MKKFQLGYTPAADTARMDTVQNGQYRPPAASRETRTEKVVRIYPPKAIGLPAPNMCKIIDVTPTDKALRLELDHYENGGSYIDEKHFGRYFQVADQSSVLTVTSNPDGTMAAAGAPAPAPTFNPAELTDDQYDDLLAKLSEFLYENNYASKTIIKNLSLEQMIDRYNIPNDLLIPAQ